MIAEKIQREVDALRKLLAPLGTQLPPLTVRLLDSLEAEAERVAALEDAALLNFEPQPAQGKDYGQAR
jgi:hypothetical protein